MDKFFGAKKINFQSIIIDFLGSFVSGIIGGILILIAISFISKQIGLSLTNSNLNGVKVNNIFPFILLVITYVSATITEVLTYYMLTITNSKRYIKSSLVNIHIIIFSTIAFILMMPIYILIGSKSYENILLVFMGHNIIVVFGSLLIIEFLTNYRYILLSFYGNFIGLFLTILLIIIIFLILPTSQSKILSMIIILPLINSLSHFFSQIIEYLYFKYYLITGNDSLGDIFYQIEQENK